MSETLGRRAFLKRAGLAGPALAAVAAGLPRPVAATDQTLAPFFHGVASGDPLYDRVILWTRVTPPQGHDGSPIAVGWQLALDVDMQQVILAGESWATAQHDWTVKVDPAGLAAYTYHYYRFEALGRQSLIGRTKTAAAPGQAVDHVRLGVVSCANYQQGWFNAYARLSERDDLDAIIHTGDYVYEYEDGGYGPGSEIGRGHEPPVEMTQLSHYRARYGQYKKDPDLRRLHQLFPFVTTWDDHESADNAWRDGAGNHTPEEEGDWAQRKAWSQQAYDEWLPIRSSGDPAIIYRHLAWGDLIDIVVMDTRLEGRDQQVTFPGTQVEAIGGLLITPETSDPQRHIVSPTQMQFVQDKLSQSSARWKLLVQQVIVSQWNLGGLPLTPEVLREADLPLLLRDGGNAINADAWDGYQADRTRLLQHLQDGNIDNVVILTGDVHSSWAFNVTNDPANPLAYNPITGEGSVAVEFVCPAVASESLGATFNNLSMLPVASDAFELGMRVGNPQLKYVDSTRNGYMVLDITPEHTQADWFFVNVDTPNNEQQAGESWRSENGSNKLVAADGPAANKTVSAAMPSAQPASEVASLLAQSRGGAMGLGLLGVAGLAALARRKNADD